MYRPNTVFIEFMLRKCSYSPFFTFHNMLFLKQKFPNQVLKFQNVTVRTFKQEPSTVMFKSAHFCTLVQTLRSCRNNQYHAKTINTEIIICMLVVLWQNTICWKALLINAIFSLRSCLYKLQNYTSEHTFALSTNIYGEPAQLFAGPGVRMRGHSAELVSCEPCLRGEVLGG